MEVGEVQEITIEDFFVLCEESHGKYQVDTPDGWQDINFLVKKKNRECYNLITDTGVELGCSSEHEILTHDGWKKSKDIDVNNDSVLTNKGTEELLVAKEYIGVKDTFDLQVDHKNSRYYSNGIVSHNCGKSLTCKAIASAWNMPLLRLDMGRLFGSLVGDSERNAREAIKMAEIVAPSILWVDEIEKALSGQNSSGQSDGGTTSRVLGTFLTWLQEKESPVFVVATANNHELIPPEWLRKGRFDEIFFVDLPNVDERMEIFEVLFKKKNLSPKDFTIAKLTGESTNYSGAEIEKAIGNAMLRGFLDNERPINDADVVQALHEFKPLFEMKKEDFLGVREWAEENCVFANEINILKKITEVVSNPEIDI